MAQGRAKRPHSKTKTGCMTCRKRRIKCDEVKPACRQCADSLRKCEGYQQPQVWLFKPRKPVQKTVVDNAIANLNAIVRSVSPLDPIGDSKDKRSFQFWVEQAAPIFSCYFGHSFWTELLPKIGLEPTRPAVKHMLLATASLVESAALDGVPLDENAVYQNHYTAAIQATVSSPHTESVLMACLLFACCDFMKGSVVSGLHHINSGLSIIDEWCKSSNQNLNHSKEARLIISAIAPIFVSYIDKAPTYGMGDVTTCVTACADLLTPNFEFPFIGHIEDIHRAHHALNGIAHHIARMIDWRRKALVASPPHKIQMLLADWHLAFDNFEANMLDTRRQRFSLSIQLLRVFYTLLSIMLRGSCSPNESDYSEVELEFKWIISQYDSFALAWAKDPSSREFSDPGNIEYHMGYIPPLFFTAIKCRTPSIRMAALKHLSNLRLIENNWTSCTAYRIARKIIEIENRRAAPTNSTSSNTWLTGYNNRLTHERFLIRPVEAFISDKKQIRATLEYTSYPYDCDLQSSETCTTTLLRETMELNDCPAASKVQWPLSRTLRIGGYQGGAVKPVPTGCDCGKPSQQKELLLLLKPKPE